MPRSNRNPIEEQGSATLLNHDQGYIQRLESRLDIINEFSQAIFRHNSVDDVLRDIVANCIHHLGFEHRAVYLIDEERNLLIQ